MLDENARVQDLLDYYNQERLKTHNVARLTQVNKYLRKPLGIKRAGPILAKMDNWCRVRNIDSKRWLYFQFKRLRWMYAPKLPYLIPSRKKELETILQYNKLQDTPEFSDTIRKEIDNQRRQEGKVFNSYRDLTPLAEAMKRRYLAENNPHKCLDQLQEYTFGYHPRSFACVRCPLAQECHQRLQSLVPFDILALRQGVISLQEAQIVASRTQVYGRA